MRPYTGPGAEKGVDRTTLNGKVMCGYQGWYTAEGDGSGKGWTHYQRRGNFEPGSCTIDLWPDVSELGEDEKFATPFKHADGSVAYVYSGTSHRPCCGTSAGCASTASTACSCSVSPWRRSRRWHCVIATWCSAVAAKAQPRGPRVRSDVRPVGPARAGRSRLSTIGSCWSTACAWARPGRQGLPPPRRQARRRRLGGSDSTTAGGIRWTSAHGWSTSSRTTRPTAATRSWSACPPAGATLDRDAMNDPALHEIIGKADVVSPWTVGRTTRPRVPRHAKERMVPDLKWCAEHGKDYLPVVFPGFSWHNMNPGRPLDQIPRRKGAFPLVALVNAKESGAKAIYVAMFDEMDEGTAIFKCTNDPPVGGASPSRSRGCRATITCGSRASAASSCAERSRLRTRLPSGRRSRGGNNSIAQ